MTGEERRDFETKTDTGFKDVAAIGWTEYAPEPLHMNEAKARHLKFTVGKRYPVLERKEGNDFSDRMSENFPGSYNSHYTFKTVNDNEKEVWVDEKYFIPATVYLAHEKTCGWNTVHDDGLIPEDGIEESVDIRKLATEKKVPALEIENDEELQTLSGLKECEYDGAAYHLPRSTGWTYRNAWASHNKCRGLFNTCSSISEGVVTDHGNELMNNADKCMAAIEKVFGNNKVADPDDIIGAIANHVPHLLLVWDDQLLSVNGAKTKISYTEVQAAYSGLKGLVSAKIAVKTVGKLVATQLRKLF
jgi:hypothetical protein